MGEYANCGSRWLEISASWLIEKLNSSGGQVLLEVSFAKCATEVSLAKNPPGP